MRLTQRIWDELVAPNLIGPTGENVIGVSCPRFFYMTDDQLLTFMEKGKE